MMDKEHNSVNKEQVYSVFEEMKESERQRKERKRNVHSRDVADVSDIELSDVSSQQPVPVVTQPGEGHVRYGKPEIDV